MALTMTRKVGDRVILTLPSGEEIILEVKSAPGQEFLRLSIDAPSNVKILRAELRD